MGFMGDAPAIATHQSSRDCDEQYAKQQGRDRDRNEEEVNPLKRKEDAKREDDRRDGVRRPERGIGQIGPVHIKRHNAADHDSPEIDHEEAVRAQNALNNGTEEKQGHHVEEKMKRIAVKEGRCKNPVMLPSASHSPDMEGKLRDEITVDCKRIYAGNDIRHYQRQRRRRLLDFHGVALPLLPRTGLSIRVMTCPTLLLVVAKRVFKAFLIEKLIILRPMVNANSQPDTTAFAAQKVVAAYGSTRSWSRQFRERRFERLQALIDAIIEQKGTCRIVDLGGTQYYWDIAADYVAARPVEILLINKQAEVSRNQKIRTAPGDVTGLADYADQSFDLVHSNSVIEHVGDWSAMAAMAREARRLAPYHYVQTPNFWFPVEPHFRCAFFHWLPEPVRMRLVMRFSLGFAQRKETVHDAMQRVQSARLLDRRQMSALFSESDVISEKFFGLTKSLTAVKVPTGLRLG